MLDDSGSIGTCTPWYIRPIQSENCADDQVPPNEPSDLRYSAARLLVHMADEGDRVAVIRFGSVVGSVGSGQLEPVGPAERRSPLIETIQPPASYADGSYTRIDLALQRAAEILSARSEPERPGYILFLTDGEPTQPDNVSQMESVRQSVTDLQSQGVQIFPVALCTRECPVEFLNQTMGSASTVGDASQLLPVFSRIFSRMKPELNVVDQRNGAGNLELFTRAAHGVRQLNMVTVKDDFVALTRDGAQQSVRTTFQDENIQVNVTESDVLPEGRWAVETGSSVGFIVAQAGTYPQVVHPPPSVAGSVAAPFFVPSGKPALVIAQAVGSGSGESLRLDGEQVLQPLTADGSLHYTIIHPPKSDFSLQVGDDSAPLQIVRQFQLIPRDDLPEAQAPVPNCQAAQPCTLEVEFEPGVPVGDLQATVYVTDMTEGEALAYSGEMLCEERRCTNQGFQPVGEHSYLIRYVLQATSGEMRFGDWAETSLAMKPTLYVRGLPEPLDLRAQPEGGWPVTIVASATGDLGQLSATLSLQRGEEGMAVHDVRVFFGADVRGAGEQEGMLRVEGVESLPPGQYSGQISFAAENPSALDVQLPDPVAVGFTVEPMRAALENRAIDFGTVLFDPSPNFRIDQAFPIDVQFNKEPFALLPVIEESNCQGLSITADTPQPLDGGSYQVMLHLQSDQPITPGTCAGTVALQGSTDVLVQPDQPLSWKVAVKALEWGIRGVEQGGQIVSAANFSDFGDTGEAGRATLLVHYTGKPPFSLRLRDLNAIDDQKATTLSGDELEFVLTGNPTPVPDEPDLYRIPVALVAKGDLPRDWYSGARYSGSLELVIDEIPGASAATLDFSFRNPSWVQQHVLFPMSAFYHWWWPGLITRPLTLMLPFMLIFMLLAVKNRNAINRRRDVLARKEAKGAELEDVALEWREPDRGWQQTRPERRGASHAPPGASARRPARPRPSARPSQAQADGPARASARPSRAPLGNATSRPRRPGSRPT
ncbi:MAG: VWA domain-containing protein [Chloroflexota bacterium]|nr:VWA domain-containing protein [Chloroflexota bacterium]